MVDHPDQLASSKFAETIDRILFKIYGAVKKAVIDFKRQALNRRNIRYFIYYACINFCILLLYSYYQSLQPVNLDLKPVTSPATEGSSLLFVAAVILLPFSLLLEELGFRLMPMIIVRDACHLNSVYHHWIWVFIVVSAVWAGLLHQINVVNSDVLGSLIYFGVQAFSGFCFAWIYAKRGLGASWAVHTAWDLFIVALNLVILIF